MVVGTSEPVRGTGKAWKPRRGIGRTLNPVDGVLKSVKGTGGSDLYNPLKQRVQLLIMLGELVELQNQFQEPVSGTSPTELLTETAIAPESSHWCFTPRQQKLNYRPSSQQD